MGIVNLKKLNNIIKQDIFCRMMYNPIFDMIYYADTDLRYEGCVRSCKNGWYHIDVSNTEETIETFSFGDGKTLKWYYSEFICEAAHLSRAEQRVIFLESHGIKEDDNYSFYGVMRLNKESIKMLMKKELDTIEKHFERYGNKSKN